MLKSKIAIPLIIIAILTTSFISNQKTALGQENAVSSGNRNMSAPTDKTEDNKTANPKCNIFTIDLHRGDTGQAVAKMQQFLNQEGYGAGVVDGVFGYNTWLAVLTFQERYAKEILQQNGFSKATGNWSSHTRNKANKVACSDPSKVYQMPEIQTKESKSGLISPPLTKQDIINRLLANSHSSSYVNCQYLFRTTKTEGDIGEEVLKIQEFLKSQNLYTDKIDGIYDTNVSLAVKDFQEKYFNQILTQAGFTRTTGVWGPATYSHANKTQKCS